MRIIFAGLLLLLAAVPALSHSWYDHTCCSDTDCHPIADCSEIKEVDGGYEWKEASTGIKFFFARDRLKASHDNQCHVCTLNFNGLCLYIPMPS